MYGETRKAEGARQWGELAVIGKIEVTDAGNIVLRVGIPQRDERGKVTSWEQTGTVVLTPDGWSEFVTDTELKQKEWGEAQ